MERTHIILLMAASVGILLAAYVLLPGRSNSPTETQPYNLQDSTIPPSNLQSSSTLSDSSPPADESWGTLYDDETHLSLKFPSSWKAWGVFENVSKTPDGHFLGSAGFKSPDEKGFLRYNALTTVRDSLDAYVAVEVSTPRRGGPTYGLNPMIEKTTVSGCEARVIHPASDSQRAQIDAKYLYMKCPNLPGLFYLEADKEHFRRIIQTIHVEQ